MNPIVKNAIIFAGVAHVGQSALRAMTNKGDAPLLDKFMFLAAGRDTNDINSVVVVADPAPAA